MKNKYVNFSETNCNPEPDTKDFTIRNPPPIPPQK
jgi:hypothetical protein